MCIITFLSYHLAHIFAPGWGPFSVCMHCLGVSWVLDLQVHLFPIIFPTITLMHSIVSHWLCSLSFFFIIIISTTCFASYSLDPEWWSSSIHYMEDSHIISTIYHTNIDLEILSLRRSSCQREFLRVCISIIDIIFGAHLFMFRVCPFVYM